MFKRTNIEIASEDFILRGWLYIPQPLITPLPCIIISHGFSALKEHYLDQFAIKFVEAGFVVIVYDHRNFGDSDGLPRLEVNPELQMLDMQNVITYAKQQTFIDNNKIGLFGTSFSAGLAIVVSAIDKRVHCLVAQVPFVHGHHDYLKKAKPDEWLKISKRYETERHNRKLRKAPTMINVIDEGEKNGIIKAEGANHFFESIPNWVNQVTLLSLENSGNFVPEQYIEQLSIPVLFIIADHDTVNRTSQSLNAFQKIKSEKKCVMISGNHFTPYVEHFKTCVEEAVAWFSKFLKN